REKSQCILPVMASADLLDELTCAICTDIYRDPAVTVNCGHSFCHECITSTWDNQEKRKYFCPECLGRFRVRPLIKRDLKVSNITEKHVLTEPTALRENWKCCVHRKVLEYYCLEESVFICVSCSLAGEHRGYRVETLNEASEKKEKLRNILQKLTSQREEAEKSVQSLEELRRQVQEKAAGVTERVTALITNIREQAETPEKEALSEISRQEEQVSLRVSDLIRQLEIKKEELSRKMGDIEELLTRWHVSMDVNTASNYVSVSDDLKTVSWSEMTQSRPETPERFQDFHQVLSSSRFSSGRHYWEVEVSESGWWVVGMVYPTIERRGDQSAIGINSVSWGLGRGWFNNQYSVIHDSKLIQLPHSSSGQRLGILLDYEVGRLSFYELCDPIRHVHTFTAVFTEPLHAVFGVYRYNSSVRISGILCPLK
uniref:Uncharacterized protein n=1 Tax=Leptobrachium leishanense TaxID=445787 RepID=A0A8C5PMM6_9ANUR